MPESRAYKQSVKIYIALQDAYRVQNKFQIYISSCDGGRYDVIENKVSHATSEAIQLTIDHLQEALNHSYRALTHSEMTYFEEHVMGFLPLE